MKVDFKDWALFGAFAGLVSVLLGQVLSMLPVVQVTFSAVELNIRQHVLAASGMIESVGTYLLAKFGGGLSLPAVLVSVLAGAILILAARYLLAMLPFKLKDDWTKLAALFFVATLLEMVAVEGLGIPAFESVMGFVIGAVALAVVMKLFYQLLGMKLPA